MLLLILSKNFREKLIDFDKVCQKKFLQSLSVIFNNVFLGQLLKIMRNYCLKTSLLYKNEFHCKENYT